MSTRSLDDAIAASHNALAAIVNGDPSGYQALYAEDEVPTLGNPFGPFALGLQNVVERKFPDGSAARLYARRSRGHESCPEDGA